MWFDCVVIDHLLEDGMLDSFHIRSIDNEPFPIDRLEDIDPNFRTVDASDVGPVRVYNRVKMSVCRLQSRLKNFAASPGEIRFQLDHFGIPVTVGYYALVFPKKWRAHEIKIYDPYDKGENVAEKRSFRNVKLCWDSQSLHSFAQLEMRSRRARFSLGAIGSLLPSDSASEFLEAEAPMTVLFTEPGHDGHPMESAYREEADRIISNIKEEDSPKMPGINLGLSGPSINVVEWTRYLGSKIRRPR